MTPADNLAALIPSHTREKLTALLGFEPDERVLHQVVGAFRERDWPLGNSWALAAMYCWLLSTGDGAYAERARDYARRGGIDDRWLFGDGR